MNKNLQLSNLVLIVQIHHYVGKTNFKMPVQRTDFSKLIVIVYIIESKMAKIQLFRGKKDG